MSFTVDVKQTDNKIGQPLVSPSRQTILPVVTNNGNIRGFFTIAATTFTGAETSFVLADGPVAITSVTLPKKVDNGSGYGVEQYMAVVYNDVEERLRPWLGYSAFVNTNDTGYRLAYTQPTQGYMSRFNRGVLITNLLVGMADEAPMTVPLVPPEAHNGVMRWAASMNVNSTQLNCGFFDFQWITLFRAKSDRKALRIEIVSNPAGGVFKSTLVPNPVVTPEGNTEFNTVRIIKLVPATPGAYVFVYKVTDDQDQSTTCQLTLTIV